MNSKREQVLKVDEAGRVWTPRELRDAVLDEFERSGIPATHFAARLGVKYPTFASWALLKWPSQSAGDVKERRIHSPTPMARSARSFASVRVTSAPLA